MRPAPRSASKHHGQIQGLPHPRDRKKGRCPLRGPLARRPRPGRGGGARGVFERQLQGRARGDRSRQDHPPLPLRRGDRPVGDGDGFRRRTLFARGCGHLHELRPGRGARRRLLRVRPGPGRLGGSDAQGNESLRSDGARNGRIHGRPRDRAHGGERPHTGKRSGHRERCDRRRRLDRDRRPFAPRVSRCGADRQGKRNRLPQGARRKGSDVQE